MSYFFSATIIKLLASLLILPILLSRLTTGEYGAFILYLSISGFLSLFICFNFNVTINAFYTKWEEDNCYKDNQSYLIFIIFVCCIFSIAVMLLINSIILIMFGRGIPNDLALSVLCLSFFSVFHDLNLNKLTMEGKAKTYLGIVIISVLIDVLGKYFYISNAVSISTNDLILINTSALSPFFLYSLVLFLRNFKFDDFSIVKSKLLFKSLWDYSGPLLFSSGVTRFVSLFDKVVIGVMLGDNSLGIYAFASRVYGIIGAFRTNVKSIWMAHAIKNYDNMAEVNRTAKIFVILGFVISVLAFIASYPFVIIFVEDSRFIESIPLIGWFVLANFAMMIYLVSSVIVPVSKNSKPILKLQLVVSVVTFFSLPLLCFLFGILGAVLSVVLSNILFAIFIRQSYKEHPLPKSFIGGGVGLILVITMVYNFPIVEFNVINLAINNLYIQLKDNFWLLNI